MSADQNSANSATAALAEIVHRIAVFMLTSQRADGSLRSMPVVRARTAFDGTIWLFADPASLAATELTADSQVNLSHSDTTQCQYVSLSGCAEIVQDRERALSLWNPDFREWLPSGFQDPSHGLVRVTIQHAEYWDAAHSAMRQFGGILKGIFVGNRPTVGNHQSIELQEPTPDAINS